jgi:glycosyltransferase involved in cell wall biosynthesis
LGAVQTGFKYAIIRGYDIAFQYDADCQHDPSFINLLIEPIIKNEADVVIGSRYIENFGYCTPIFRRMGMVTFSLLSSLTLRIKITDTTSGFRALNKIALSFFARYYPVDFPDAEAIVLLGRNGFRIKEIPVQFHPRSSGSSSISFLKSVYYPFKSFIAIFAAILEKRRRE